MGLLNFCWTQAGCVRRTSARQSASKRATGKVMQGVLCQTCDWQKRAGRTQAHFAPVCRIEPKLQVPWNAGGRAGDYSLIIRFRLAYFTPRTINLEQAGRVVSSF